MAIRKRNKEEDERERVNLAKTGKPSAENDSGEGGADINDPPKRTGPILELNYAPWHKFRRLSGTEENESYVIDVLEGEPIIDHDVSSSKYAHRIRRLQTPRPSDLGSAVAPGQGPLPERVRIHSNVLRAVLAGMLSTKPSSIGISKSFVVVRPFKSLFHCYDDMKSLITKLEEKLSRKQEPVALTNEAAELEDNTHVEKHEEQATQVEGQSGGDSHPDEQDDYSLYEESSDGDISDGGSSSGSSSDSEDETEKAYDPNDPSKAKRALQHLKTLREFMDSQITAKMEYLQTAECRKVFFADLWYLFRPGQEVIGRDGKQAYRVVHVSSLRHRKAQPWDAWRWYNPQETEKKRKSPFSITCVHIDFDGSSIGPVSKTFDFKQFDGQMEITSLPVYPIRLHPLKKAEVSDKDWSELESLAPEKRYRQHLVNRGARFLTVLGIKPMYYAGPTLGVRDDIESQVVIDFETAFAVEDGKEKQWKPSLEMLLGSPVSEDDEKEDVDPICRGECCRLDAVYDDSYIDDKQRSRYVNSLLPSSRGPSTQPSIAVFPQPLRELVDSESRTGYSISDDELVIMSYRVFGFILRHRQWAELDISYLTELHAHRQPVGVDEPRTKDDTSEGRKFKTAFDNLVLEEEQKPMIQALVAQHFRDKVYKAGQTSQTDIVKGKGKGLILLLHGAPGVGKTSTAEGVAELFNRPLFQITCGDLGTTAREVEKALDINFTLANRWDCILLLDEADVFLAQRNKEDFQRNGLVAVFLRVLEYYAGVLFLTTNRVGDFDEAFTSRIHISLYYPELNCDKTIKVFDINIKMIQERFRDKGRIIVVDNIKTFAAAHYYENRKARWNGRQIRNACRTALALAEFEAQGNSHTAILKPDAVVRLKLSHFETVQKAYLDFAHYMDTIYGSSTDTRAQEGKVRAILELIGENPGNKAKGVSTSKKEEFRNAARARTEPLQQPSTPVTQPVAPQPQPPAAGQPIPQPMYAPGNQQYLNAAALPQGYYQNPMYSQYAQHPMGLPQMQHQFAALPQQMQLIQPPVNPSQPQPQSMMSPNASQVWNSPVATPENNNAQQPRAAPEVHPHTPPSQRQQATNPQQLNVTAAGSPWFGRNIQDMYSAGSPEASGAGYPQQQQQQQQQSGDIGGPPPPGQFSGPSGTVHPTGPHSHQGQWPVSQGG
ncbi:hypothetical protein PG997_014347 [Apiospora hydei]|uniref:AAA+ ATPase domain-containing protein n=1 Tax=Apiospora hydei TaxID=1337664 RepID=A0ABR1UTK7_9PEZI